MHRLRRISAAKSVRSFQVMSGIISVSFLFCFLAACGGHKPAGSSPFPGRVILSPGISASLQLGGTLNFTASAQNNSGSVLAAAFTYQSSNTTILNVAPNGVACAGVWDAAFVTCTPQNYGTVEVTASALGATSEPTLVYVHPPIDSVTINAVCPENGIPPACPGPQTIPDACMTGTPATQYPSCTPGQNPVPIASVPPCLSANQSITLQANAFSKGLNITAAVGPFTWSETSNSVVSVSPLITDTNANIPTNQASVAPSSPGFTAVYASASNVSSQPYYAETCPVQCVALAVGSVGSGQTSFAASKSSSATETVIATAVDVQGCVVPKAALSWSSSQPGAVVAGTAAAGCAAGASCAIATPAAGAGSITASCIPPTCNIGFPQSVAGLGQPLVQPVPVYPVTAISGLVTGSPTPTSVLATTLDCTANLYCNTYLYNVSTSTNVSGNPFSIPAPPNSLLLDPAGDKAYMGGNYGSVIVTTGNFGGASSPFAGLSTVTGKVLATSPNGNYAIFSDTLHTPNLVFVANTTTANSPAITTLYISGATAAYFSRDGLKAFIVGPTGPTCTAVACLYVYSPVQALQTIPLAAPATGITFSANGAFAFINGGSTTSTISVYNTCDNSSNPLVITLPTSPLFLYDLPPGSPPPPIASAGLIQPVTACVTLATNPASYPCVGLDVLVGLDTTGLDLIATNSSQQIGAPSCAQSITIATNPATTIAFNPQHYDLGQGAFNPIAFFMSPDASTAYVVASDHSEILAFNFNTGTTSGIPLTSATGSPVSPVAASMTVDGDLIYVAASDGELHEVSTLLNTDLMQISFPNLPDVNNPFCSSGSTTIACNLDLVAVKQ